MCSDHYAVLVQLKISVPPKPPRYVETRHLASINLEAFRVDLRASLQLLSSPSADKFHSVLQDVLDHHAPILRRKISNGPPSPWFSAVASQVLDAKQERRRAERKWLKTKLEIHKQLLRIANNLVNEIVQHAKAAYFSAKIVACTSTKQLFSVTDALMGRFKSTPLPSTICSSDLPQSFCDYFINKIRTLRASLDSQSVSEPDVQYASFAGSPFTTFQPVTETLLKDVIKNSVIKTCVLDPLPTSLLSAVIDDLLPYITSIVNDSLLSGCFPSALKAAIVRPLLKKPTLDPENLKNYRPVSNLSFLSKIIEKVALLQLQDHLDQNNLLYPLQSAYRAGHSTETALLKIVNDLLCALDDGKVSLLSLLDLSSAFDTIDHHTLLSRLQHTFGISNTALSWFQSYLHDRSRAVSVNGLLSLPAVLQYGVPQGSVLGPILFVLYTQPISDIVSHHGISHHCFSDDNQIYSSTDPSSIPSVILCTQSCISDIKSWMTCNKLQLNNDKTEMIFIVPKRLLPAFSVPTPVQLGDCLIHTSTSVRNLGVTLDQTLSFQEHISSVCRSCYLELRRIGSTRHLLTADATKILVSAFVLSRLDYCNSLLAGCPQTVLSKLQKLQNYAARLVLRTSKFSHSTPMLQSLHWLPVQQRIDYKLSLLCFKSLNGLAPSYLADLLKLYTPLRQLRSSSDTSLLHIPRFQTRTLGERSFSFQVPSVWNKLPLSIRSDNSLSSFKSSLKTTLFPS